MLFKIFIVSVIIIVSIVIILILLFWGFSYAFYRAAQPNTPLESVDILKTFLGFDFGSNYYIVEHNSRNYHPDRPMNIEVLLPVPDFDKVIAYLNKIELGTVINQKNEIKHSESWDRKENGYSKYYTASHINKTDSDYPFFMAGLMVDMNNRSIRYKEFGI